MFVLSFNYKPEAGSADVPSAQRAKHAPLYFLLLDKLFALRAQCGRDVRAPSISGQLWPLISQLQERCLDPFRRNTNHNLAFALQTDLRASVVQLELARAG